MPHFGMTVPYATMSLPGLRGSPLGITDGRLTHLLSGGRQLGAASVPTMAMATGGAALVAIASGAFVGSKTSVGAGSGALIGAVLASLIMTPFWMKAVVMAEVEAQQREYDGRTTS